MWPSKYKYDAFISHAVEDKLAIANELCTRLEDAGLKIWYSGKELMVGDSLEKTIQKGLDRSRYGVVVLSPKYLQKNWTMKEFYMLLDKEIEHRKVILPVLYELTIEDLLDKNMPMTDKWAIPFSKGMDSVVKKLVSEIKTPREKPMTVFEWLEENFYALKFWFFIVTIISLCTVLAVYISNQSPSNTLVENIIRNHISEVNQLIAAETSHPTGFTRRSSSSAEIDVIYNEFMALNSSYRNEYEFYNGVDRVRTRKHVENVLQQDVSSLSPFSSYSFTDPTIYSDLGDSSSGFKGASYAFVNSKPLNYHIESEHTIRDGEYEIIVSYQENIRGIVVNLIYPTSSVPMKKHQMKIVGVQPIERILLQKKGSHWVLRAIE